MNAQFAGVRNKQIALDANKIAVIEQTECGPTIFFVERVFSVVPDQSKRGLLSVDLKFIYAVRQMNKIANATPMYWRLVLLLAAFFKL